MTFAPLGLAKSSRLRFHFEYSRTDWRSPSP